MADTLIDRKLLSVKEFSSYINVSERTARTMLAEPNCPYVCRIRGRIFANKTILDKWIDNNTGR